MSLSHLSLRRSLSLRFISIAAKRNRRSSALNALADGTMIEASCGLMVRALLLLWVVTRARGPGCKSNARQSASYLFARPLEAIGAVHVSKHGRKMWAVGLGQGECISISTLHN